MSRVRMDWRMRRARRSRCDRRGVQSCHAPTERLEVLNRRSTILPRNPHAAALGRLGGLKGGRARAAVLSPQKRREIARHAARERWRKAVV